MNDDRGARGEEVTEAGGRIPGHANDHHFGPAFLDGVAGGGVPRVAGQAPAGWTDGGAAGTGSAPGYAGAGSAPKHAGAGSTPGNAGTGPDGGPAGPEGTPGGASPGGVPGAGVPSDGVPGGGAPGGGGPGGEAAGEETPGDGPGPAAAPTGTARGKKARRATRSWWVELPILLVFALALALVIKTFVVQAFYIPSSSMENTLNIGDKVLVNKLVYDFRSIHRGDIVVFNGDGSWDAEPVAPKPLLQRLWGAVSGLFGTAPGVHDYIKRVIGVPGDHVMCCDAKGRISVNGVQLSEASYLHPGDEPSTTSFDITVPPGRLWVMGDNRNVSYDSRGHIHDPGGGTIPEDHVVGRAFLIIAPISRWRVLPIPSTFEQPKLAAALSQDPVLPGALGVAGSPAAPLALGFAGAVPLTLLQRRVRRRLLRPRAGSVPAAAGPGGAGAGPGRAGMDCAGPGEDGPPDKPGLPGGPGSHG